MVPVNRVQKEERNTNGVARIEGDLNNHGNNKL